MEIKQLAYITLYLSTNEILVGILINNNLGDPNNFYLMYPKIVKFISQVNSETDEVTPITCIMEYLPSSDDIIIPIKKSSVISSGSISENMKIIYLDYLKDDVLSDEENDNGNIDNKLNTPINPMSKEDRFKLSSDWNLYYKNNPHHNN